MSACDLGCVKTPALSADVETFWTLADIERNFRRAAACSLRSTQNDSRLTQSACPPLGLLCKSVVGGAFVSLNLPCVVARTSQSKRVVACKLRRLNQGGFKMKKLFLGS